LNVNGEAIYASIPWKYQNDTTNSHVWWVCLIVKLMKYFFLKGIHNQTIINPFMQLFLFGPTMQQKLHLVHQWLQQVQL
jgi:cellobiose-specific phosphotransferase system component IIC